MPDENHSSSQNPIEPRRLIVTHQNPDLDAIMSVWLLKRFLTSQWGTAKVWFVQAGKTIAPETLDQLGIENEREVIHVDTGMGEFDHHQEERGQMRICAASLVYDYLIQQQSDKRHNKALQEMVKYAIEIDHFEDCYWPDASSYRYEFMITGILSGSRETGIYDDDRKLQFGMEMLDAVYASLRNEVKADEIIQKEGQPFKVRDGQIQAIALASSNHAVEKRAQKKGFELMVRKDEGAGHIRIKATPRSEIDLTRVYEEILKQDSIGTWFLHASKRMLLNGSSKANQNPSPLSLTQVVKICQQVL
jgi:hypothetical protein